MYDGGFWLVHAGVDHLVATMYQLMAMASKWSTWVATNRYHNGGLYFISDAG